MSAFRSIEMSGFHEATALAEAGDDAGRPGDDERARDRPMGIIKRIQDGSLRQVKAAAPLRHRPFQRRLRVRATQLPVEASGSAAQGPSYPFK